MYSDERLGAKPMTFSGLMGFRDPRASRRGEGGQTKLNTSKRFHDSDWQPTVFGPFLPTRDDWIQGFVAR